MKSRYTILGRSAVYQGFQALTADDIAEAIFWCVGLPPRVNINCIELMPQDQSFGPFAVRRS